MVGRLASNRHSSRATPLDRNVCASARLSVGPPVSSRRMERCWSPLVWIWPAEKMGGVPGCLSAPHPLLSSGQWPRPPHRNPALVFALLSPADTSHPVFLVASTPQWADTWGALCAVFYLWGR